MMRDVLELVVLAVVRQCGPSALQSFCTISMPSSKIALVVGERHLEGRVFACVVAAAGGEIDAAAREQVERRPLLGDTDRMVQRQ